MAETMEARLSVESFTGTERGRPCGMKIRRTGKALLLSAAIGASGAYLLDPDRGQQRRDRLAERAKRRSNDVRDLAAKAADVKEAVTGGAGEAEADCPPAVPGVTRTTGDVPTQAAGDSDSVASDGVSAVPDAEEIGTDLSTGHRPL